MQQDQGQGSDPGAPTSHGGKTQVQDARSGVHGLRRDASQFSLLQELYRSAFQPVVTESTCFHVALSAEFVVRLLDVCQSDNEEKISTTALIYVSLIMREFGVSCMIKHHLYFLTMTCLFICPPGFFSYTCDSYLCIRDNYNCHDCK